MTFRKEVQSLQTADHEHPREDKTIGVRQLQIDLGRVLANRGRIWTKCEKQKTIAAPSGILKVTLSTEDTFAKNMLFYAFEEGDDQSPGKYLGEFAVDAVSDKQVVLASTTQMAKSTDPKVKSLADNVLESKGPWVLYEMMPTDQHEAFADLSDDQRKWVADAFTSLPAEQRKQAADEYFNDGQSIDATGKLSSNPNDKKFERPLRDYLAIFRACEIHRTLFAQRWESAVRDLSYLQAANDEATKLEALAEKQKTEVAKDLQRSKVERGAVASLCTVRQKQVATFQGLVQAAIAQNAASARTIATLQKQAADLIDRRTRDMAQFGAGAN